MSTSQPALPVASDRIRPSSAGPTRIAVRVCMRPRTVGHTSLRELLGHADAPDRARAAPGERQLHPQPSEERPLAHSLGPGAVGYEPPPDVLQAGDGVAVRDDVV